MSTRDELDIFLVTAPGLEDLLRAEAVEKGFRKPKAEPGGVSVRGGWAEVWRANLELRGASRVLVRIAAFRVKHLAQLDKLAREVPWGDVLRPDVPVHVEAACKKSRIYHSGAAAERLAKAVQDELGAPVTKDAVVSIKVRILKDVCTISIDTSGDALHKRGHKEAVSKAPMRENLAAMFLRQCGYKGREPVFDPMCGSGTFVIEAAEIAARLFPGRSRSFAFEQLSTFDETAWQDLRARQHPITPDVRFCGSDVDAGAVRMSDENAARAGVDAFCDFALSPIEEIAPPPGPPGLVMINPPYGTRIGDVKQLTGLYKSLGHRLMAHFPGWRVGLVTSVDHLAQVTGLPFAHESGPVVHGGLRVKVHSTAGLPQP